MRITRTVAAFAMVTILGSGVGWAGGPAELPPASFTGTQYVDSKGCVFVRADYNGAVNWVPRVNRSKEGVCGHTPTIVKAPQPVPKPDDAVAMPAASAAPKPAGEPIETIAASVAAPKAKTAPARAATPAVAATSRRRLAKPTPRQIDQARQAACQSGDTAQARAILVNGYQVRCAVQADLPAGSNLKLRNDLHIVIDDSGQTAGTAGKPGIPAGYMAAWTDGRLNPDRGPRTAAGDAQMAQIFEPGVVPMVERTAARATAPTSARVVRIVPKVRYSVGTKNDPKAAVVPPPAMADGKIWIQVGTYGEPANAAGAIARLKAAGLPVATSSTRKGSKTLRIVLAGPFANPAQIRDGLATARRAGFGDAFARN